MRAFEQGDSLVCALSGVFVKLRQRAQLQVVGIEALSRFPGRALDLGLAELVRNRIAAPVAKLDPGSERDALLWIEAVSEFDTDEPR